MKKIRNTSVAILLISAIVQPAAAMPKWCWANLPVSADPQRDPRCYLLDSNIVKAYDICVGKAIDNKLSFPPGYEGCKPILLEAFREVAEWNSWEEAHKRWIVEKSASQLRGDIAGDPKVP